MKEYILNLDKPRKLKYGFKALRIIREKYGGKKELTDIMNVNIDEIPFFAYAGLTGEDETLTPEQVEELIDDKIPDRYTVLDIVNIIAEAITDQIGVKPEKKKEKDPFEDYRKIAFEIGVKTHSEFDELTPAELREQVEAYKEREKKEWQRIAWLGAVFASYISGKRVKPSSLLPEAFSEKIMTKEDKEKELEALRKRLKVK